MKRKVVTVGILCALVLFLAANTFPARAAITNWNWIGAVTKGTIDDFYGEPITAYEENTTAVFVISVYNNYAFADQINVSAVIVGFDWGQNYTSTECNLTKSFVIPLHQSHLFTITFTVPSVLVASNYVLHSYNAYVEQVNSTSAPQQLVLPTWTQSGSYFAVFSSDQEDAFTYREQINAYPSTTTIGGFPFVTGQGRELIVQSSVAKTLADNYYVQGDFSDAKQHYVESLNYLQEAFSNETQQWTSIENSLTNLLNDGGSLLMFQGYAWLLFGFGFLLMGIGVLIYLARKRVQSRTEMPAPPSNQKP